MSILNIKNAIKSNLDDLVTDEILGGTTATDIKKNPLDAFTALNNHAYLMPPAVESEVLDNRSVLRTYVFDIVIIINAKNIISATQVEELIEAVMDKFDNDPTLQGTARGGLLPISSSPAPFQHNGQDLIMVVFQLQAKADVSLSFS